MTRPGVGVDIGGITVFTSEMAAIRKSIQALRVYETRLQNGRDSPLLLVFGRVFDQVYSHEEYPPVL